MAKTKIKTTLGLTTILGILALTTTAATANFTAVNSGSTSGSSQLKTGSTAELIIATGVPPITSSKAPDSWRIQDTKAEQRVTKEGGHLDQTIEFQEIRAPELVIVNNPITVQFVRTGPSTSDVSISKVVELIVTVGGAGTCTVRIAPETANKQLTKVKDTNIESSKALEANVEITNLKSTSEPESICKLVGIPPTSETGTFKQITIEHGVIQRP